MHERVHQPDGHTLRHIRAANQLKRQDCESSGETILAAARQALEHHHPVNMLNANQNEHFIYPLDWIMQNIGGCLMP